MRNSIPFALEVENPKEWGQSDEHASLPCCPVRGIIKHPWLGPVGKSWR
jgi:hypothetical protein